MSLTIAATDKIAFFGDSITFFNWQQDFLNSVNALYTPTAPRRYGTTGTVRLGPGTVSISSVTGANPRPSNFSSGVVGNKVSDLQARVAADIIAQSPNVVIIECGVNDFIAAIGAGTFGTNAAALQSTILASLPSCKLAWVYIFCYFENYPDPNNATINSYNAALAAPAVLVDVRTPQQAYEQTYNTLNQAVFDLTIDGVHPTAAGKLMMSNTMLAACTFTGTP